MSNLWKSTRRWLPGVIISAIAIAAILYFIDLQRFVEAVRSANYWLLLAAFISTMIWLAVRGIVWHTLLRARASYRDVFLTLCEGYLLNNFLPFRLGEIGRAFLLGRKSKMGFMDVLSTIIIERILDLVFSAAILLCAVPFIVGAAEAGNIAITLGGVTVIGLAALFVLARNRVWALGLFQKYSSRWPGFQKQGGDFLSSLFSGLSTLTDGWLFLRVLLWMAFNWTIAIFQFHLLIIAFFPQATLVWSLFGLGAVAFGNAIPSLPGALGTFEGALGGAIMLLGGDQSTALAAALTSHLFNYLSTGVFGLYALSSEGETMIGIYRQLSKKQISWRSSEGQGNLPVDDMLISSGGEIPPHKDTEKSE
jgi:glycosyltransferase 2 family protein